MTFKRTKFDESPVMRSFEKVAMEKGLIEPDPVVKEASAAELYAPTDDLFSDMVRLANGLREKGFVDEAVILEDKIFEHKRAAKEAKDEGEKMLDEAHPEGDVEVAPSKGGYGKMLTQKTTQDEIKKIVNKTPTGKYAQLADPATAAEQMAETFGNFIAQSAMITEDADDISDMVDDELERVLREDAGLGRFVLTQRNLNAIVRNFEKKLGEQDWAAQIAGGGANEEAFKSVAGNILARCYPHQGPLGEGESGYCMDAKSVVSHIVMATEDALGIQKRAVDIPGENVPVVNKERERISDWLIGSLKEAGINVEYFMNVPLPTSIWDPTGGIISGIKGTPEDDINYALGSGLMNLRSSARSHGQDFKTYVTEFENRLKASLPKTIKEAEDAQVEWENLEDKEVTKERFVVDNVILGYIGGAAHSTMADLKPYPDKENLEGAKGTLNALYSSLEPFIAKYKDSEEADKKTAANQAENLATAIAAITGEIRFALSRKMPYAEFITRINKKFPIVKAMNLAQYKTSEAFEQWASNLYQAWRDILVEAGAGFDITKTADKAQQIAALRRRERALRAANNNVEADKIANQIRALEKDEKPSVPGAPTRPKTEKKEEEKRPPAAGGSYVSSPIREMQTALRDLGNLVKPKQPQRATVLMGGGIDGDWKGGTDSAIAEAEKLRREMKVGTPLVGRAGIPYANLSYTARANTATLQKMIEAYSKGGLAYTARQGQSYGKYKTPEENDVEIFSTDVRSLRSFLRFMERTGVIHEVRGPSGAPPRPGEGSAYTAKEEEEVFFSPEEEKKIETGKIHTPGAPGGPRLMPQASRKEQLAKLAQENVDVDAPLNPWADKPKDEPKPKAEKPKSTGPRGIGLTYGEWDKILKHFKDAAAYAYWDESVEDKLGPRRLYNKMLSLENQLSQLKQSEQEAPDELSDKVVDLDKTRAPGVPGAGLPYVPGLEPGHALVVNQRGERAQWDTSKGSPPSGWSYVYGPSGGQPGAGAGAGYGYGAGYGEVQGPPVSHGVLDLRRPEFRMPRDFRKPLYFNQFYYGGPTEFMGRFFSHVKPKSKRAAEMLYAVQNHLEPMGWSEKDDSLMVKHKKGATTLRKLNPPGYKDHMRLHTGSTLQQALRFIQLARTRLAEVYNRWMSTLPYDPAELSRVLKPVDRAVSHWNTAFDEKEAQLRSSSM